MSFDFANARFQPNRMRTHRIPKSPMDKCTIVSVYPNKIHERKPTLFPGEFIIPGAPDNDFSILVVSGSSWFKEQLDGPMLEIPVSSFQVAQSIITDYLNGLLGYNPRVAGPGLFFMPGEYDKITIYMASRINPETGKSESFNELLEEARTRQDNWFKALVTIADTDWNNTGGNPMSISGDAKLAAQKLGLAGVKAWMNDQVVYNKTNCPACGHLVNPVFPVCPNCRHIVNPEKYKELNLGVAV